MDRINESLKRVTGPAKELLQIIKKEIEDVAEAFATGEPPKAENSCKCKRCGCGKKETPAT